MGCKAQTTAIAVAIARICNAADRPKQGCAVREGFVQRCPNPTRANANAWRECPAYAMAGAPTVIFRAAQTAADKSSCLRFMAWLQIKK